MNEHTIIKTTTLPNIHINNYNVQPKLHTTFITTTFLALTGVTLSAAIPDGTTHHGSVTYCSGPARPSRSRTRTASLSGRR